MLRSLRPIAALFALALLSPVAHAQRYRGGPVISPYGVEYNTASPEWRQAGGDLGVYQQLMEQKAMQQQMQQMQKQQAAYEKQVQDYLKKNPEVKKQLEEQQKKMIAAQQPRAKKKKKKPTSAASVNGAATAKVEEAEEKTAAAGSKPAEMKVGDRKPMIVAPAASKEARTTAPARAAAPKVK